MQILANQLKFEGTDKWTVQFNLCSDLLAKSDDESLTDQEREDSFQLYINERQRLELGMY